MVSPRVYINLAQVMAIGGAVILGVHYMNIQRDAVGIQKTEFNERIKKDVKNVVGIFTTPFQHYVRNY